MRRAFFVERSFSSVRSKTAKRVTMCQPASSAILDMEIVATGAAVRFLPEFGSIPD